MKFDLEATIKATDFKHMEVFSVIESADSKRKKMEFAAQHIGAKNRELQQAVAKQKRLREIWSSLDHRENDLLNQRFVPFAFWMNWTLFPLLMTKQNF